MKLLTAKFFILLFFIQNIQCFEKKEHIYDFHSNITLHTNGTMDVEEIIKLVSTGYSIKHGITREFPTTYYDNFRNKYIVDFTIESIERDNQKEDYHVKNASNGKIIFIGSQNKYLSPGNHIYVIKYKTNRQLGFFKDHDELFWNVTPFGSRFNINYASAIVTLPADIPNDKLDVVAYTGYFAANENNYKFSILADNKILFETTKPLYRSQGLSIAVSWPKGYIQEPTNITKLKWFFKDNLEFMWLLFWLIIVLIYYFYIYFKKRGPKKGIIFPLFDTPVTAEASSGSPLENFIRLTPGEVRYISKIKYDSKVFAAEIVNMAVHGYLKIDHQTDHYILIKDNQPEEFSKYETIWKGLFKFNDSIAITSSNSLILSHVQEKLKTSLNGLNSKYFNFNHKYLAIGVLLSLLAFLPLIFKIKYLNLSFALIVFLFVLTNILFCYLLKNYTIAGRKIMDEIEGFKMFLNAAEKERLKLTNFPDKTPELYEHFLPYAIALDVEDNWSNQFAPIFKHLEQDGQYRPSWYIGRTMTRYWYLDQHSMTGFASSLSSSLSQSISSSISSSMSIPGKKSGFGRSGGAGKGGGGGGIGGW